jgi:organic hydroperoxide reductase OsmC/OhrA
MTEQMQKLRDEMAGVAALLEQGLMKPREEMFKDGFDACYSQFADLFVARENVDLNEENKELRARVQKLEDLLERAKGVAFTHAMQTYSKTAQALGEEIQEALREAHESVEMAGNDE